MVFLHPVFLAISMSGSFIYTVSLSGKRTLKFALIFLIPMMLVAGAVNPLFNHRGVTILRYMGDNPLTLESILYGVAIAVMFGTVILWFSCVNVVMTSDKLMYLFGRIIPSLSMMFSMVLRFVPKFKNQIRLISNSQKCIGRDISDGTLRQRARHGIKILSIMVSWALENAIDTADSMRSRGYGLPGRSSFAIYRFDSRDRRALICFVILILLVIAGVINDGNGKTVFCCHFNGPQYIGYFMSRRNEINIMASPALKSQHLSAELFIAQSLAVQQVGYFIVLTIDAFQITT
jgi:energy-coupling factor transport system permease protein